MVRMVVGWFVKLRFAHAQDGAVWIVQPSRGGQDYCDSEGWGMKRLLLVIQREGRVFREWVLKLWSGEIWDM